MGMFEQIKEKVGQYASVDFVDPELKDIILLASSVEDIITIITTNTYLNQQESINYIIAIL